MRTTTRTSRPPDWALLLIAQVCAEHGRRPPKVTWYWTRQALSSGHAKFDSRDIHISAGLMVRDQQLVLLHELAHYLTPKRDHHTMRFWRNAVSLYARWGDTHFMAYAVQREWTYKLKARRAFAEHVGLA